MLYCINDEVNTKNRKRTAAHPNRKRNWLDFDRVKKTNLSFQVVLLLHKVNTKNRKRTQRTQIANAIDWWILIGSGVKRWSKKQFFLFQ